MGDAMNEKGRFVVRPLKWLAAFKGRVTEVIYFGQTPLGRRLDAWFEGDLTGKLLSGRMKGVDYILVRSDNVAEIHVRAAVTTPEGINLSLQIWGYQQDGEIRDAQVKVLTGAEKYRWLGDKIIVGKGRSEGGVLEFDYYYEP